MTREDKILYKFHGLFWAESVSYGEYQEPYYEYLPLCPATNCRCKLEKAKNEEFVRGEWKYKCIKCDFKITLNKPLEDKALDVAKVIESEQYKNAEIINLDGDSIRVSRQQIDDSDYWPDVKISKNRKGEIQLMASPPQI